MPELTRKGRKCGPLFMHRRKKPQSSELRPVICNEVRYSTPALLRYQHEAFGVGFGLELLTDGPTLGWGLGHPSQPLVKRLGEANRLIVVICQQAEYLAYPRN